MSGPAYFTFNGVDSRSMGVHVIDYPPIMRPALRSQQVTLLGRAGDVTLTEGPDVYEAYNRGFRVSNQPGAPLEPVLSWLRGSGTIILGNEPDYAYDVQLIAQIQLDKHFRGCWSGQLMMHTQPFKRAAVTEADVTLTASGGTITNPGGVPSHPLITLNGSGLVTLRIGDSLMTINDAQDGMVLDCENQWLLVDGVPQIGAYSGDFPTLPVGTTAILWTGDVTSLVITPRWRYV